MVNVRASIAHLLQDPGFSGVAVLTIAIGIGANASLFSVYDQLVLNPVSVPDRDSLVAIASRNPQFPQPIPAVSWPRYREIKSKARSLSSVGIAAFDNFT